MAAVNARGAVVAVLVIATPIAAVLLFGRPPAAPMDRTAPQRGAPTVPDVAMDQHARDERATRPATGTLRGRVLLHGMSAAAFGVTVSNAMDDLHLDLRADGVFELAMAPAGCGLQIVHVANWSVPGTILGYSTPLPTWRAAEVRAGTTTEVVLDAGLGFGSVRGRVLVDDDKPNNWTITLWHIDSGTRYGVFAVAPDGSYSGGDVLSGQYRVELSRSDDPERTAVLASKFEVPAGVHFVHDVSFTPRRLVLKLRAAGGVQLDPAAKVHVATGPSYAFSAHAVDGVVTLDPASELPVKVRLGFEGAWSEPVSMPQDRREHTATVVLPAK
jgi:hypothetical protein